MRAGFIEEPGKAYFKEVPEPQIEKSTDVKIKVVVTGIRSTCLSWKTCVESSAAGFRT